MTHSAIDAPQGRRFDWDPEKETANLEKHDISFGEATELFSSGVDYMEIYDEDHSQEEEPFIAVGPARERIVLVAYADWPEDTIRVIGARPATRKEIQLYRESMKGD